MEGTSLMNPRRGSQSGLVRSSAFREEEGWDEREDIHQLFRSQHIVTGRCLFGESIKGDADSGLPNKLQGDAGHPGEHVELGWATVRQVDKGVLELILVSHIYSRYPRSR